MEKERRVLPITYTKHCVERMVALGLTREHVDEAVRQGVLMRIGKSKARMRMRRKVGVVVVTCVLFPDEIRVITINIGGEKDEMP